MDLNQRLTRLRAPLVAAGDGELYPKWNTPEDQWSKADYWCSLQPATAKEDLVAQQRVETTHLARVETKADITAVDRVRYKGDDYTVDGAPLDWTDVSIYGQEAHWKVFLKRITGG